MSREQPGPKIVYVNDGFTKMSGYTREEAVGSDTAHSSGTPKPTATVLDKLKYFLLDMVARFIRSDHQLPQRWQRNL